MKNSKKNQKGFSLIEILIVIVIIGIIAAIAVPNILAARRAANEGSAISTLRVIHSAQVAFSASTGSSARYGTFNDLKSIIAIDDIVATGQKSGYIFTTTPENNNAPANFVIDAVPSNPNVGVTQSGTRRFCMSLAGGIRADTNNIGTSINSSAECNYGSNIQ